jgi:hypothetical protein
MVAAAALAAVAIVVVVVARSIGSDDDVRRSSQAASAVAFAPNLGVEADVVASQDDGPTVVVAPHDGFYLTAERDGTVIRLAPARAQAFRGLGRCSIPAEDPWPDVPAIACAFLLDGQPFIAGAASEEVDAVELAGPSGRRVPLATPVMPFPTLQFFLIAGESEQLAAFDASGNRIATITPTPWAPADEVVTGGASVRDVAIADRLKTFATKRTPAAFADVPFSNEPVELLLGGRVVKAVPAAELADPNAWTLDVDTYNGHQGPFSALRSIAGAGDNTMSAPGPLSSCATSPSTVNLHYDEHVILEPMSVDSCTTWFGIDIYLADGHIVAVGLTFTS